MPTDTFTDAQRTITGAAAPGDLFGPVPPDGAAIPAAALAEFRRLARLVHPDRVPEPRRDAASAVFARLTAHWDDFRRMVEGGLGADDLVLTTKLHSYHVARGTGPVPGPGLDGAGAGDGPPAHGDLADLHRVRYEDNGAWHDAVLKLPRSPGDNDLMRAEAAALKAFAERGEPRHRAYLPELVESIRHRDAATGAERRGSVLGRLTGFHTLAEVHAAYPDGLDPRDLAWMWRRLLVALGAAHRAGIVHGAVLPEHVLIDAERHGLVLVDWCYSVTAEGSLVGPDPAASAPLSAMVARYADWYPTEVAAKQPAVPATDIHLATRCMTHLAGDRLPKQLRAFARGCTLPSVAQRPRDAWTVLGQLDDLLERLYGPRKFRPFTMPNTPRPR